MDGFQGIGFLTSMITMETFSSEESLGNRDDVDAPAPERLEDAGGDSGGPPHVCPNDGQDRTRFNNDRTMRCIRISGTNSCPRTFTACSASRPVTAAQIECSEDAWAIRTTLVASHVLAGGTLSAVAKFVIIGATEFLFLHGWTTRGLCRNPLAMFPRRATLRSTSGWRPESNL